MGGSDLKIAECKPKHFKWLITRIKIGKLSAESRIP